jgi:hypothetical protein
MISAAPKPAKPPASNAKLIGSGTEQPLVQAILAKACIGTSKPIATNSIKTFIAIPPTRLLRIAAFSIPDLEAVENRPP